MTNPLSVSNTQNILKNRSLNTYYKKFLFKSILKNNSNKFFVWLNLQKYSLALRRFLLLLRVKLQILQKKRFLHTYKANPYKIFNRLRKRKTKKEWRARMRIRSRYQKGRIIPLRLYIAMRKRLLIKNLMKRTLIKEPIFQKNTNLKKVILDKLCHN